MLSETKAHNQATQESDIPRPIKPRSPEEVMEAIAAAANAHDLDAFVGLHEDDAVIVVPPEGLITAQGLTDIRAALTPLFELEPGVNINLHRLLKSGDIAMSHSTFTVGLNGPSGERLTKIGMGTVVSRRQPDGTWRIVFDFPLRSADGLAEAVVDKIDGV